MAEPVLDRIHSDIRARVCELESAVGEHEQLKAAEAALAGLAPGQPSDGRARETASFRRPNPAAGASSPHEPDPRGAKRARCCGR